MDGKNTTHAMTSILVTAGQVDDRHMPRIKREISRTFDVSTLPGGNLSNVLAYKKPIKRPEPIIQPPPTGDELLPSKKLSWC